MNGLRGEAHEVRLGVLGLGLIDAKRLELTYYLVGL